GVPDALEIVVTDAWERQPHESARGYAAFRSFRDLGPTRKLDDVESDAPKATLRKWKSHNGWEARCRAWDAECHRQEDERRLDAIRSMDDYHAKTARVLIGAGLRALQRFGDDLTPGQAARFVDIGTRLERATLLGDHLESPASLVPVDPDEGLSPLERIARD